MIYMASLASLLESSCIWSPCGGNEVISFFFLFLFIEVEAQHYTHPSKRTVCRMVTVEKRSCCRKTVQTKTRTQSQPWAVFLLLVFGLKMHVLIFLLYTQMKQIRKYKMQEVSKQYNGCINIKKHKKVTKIIKNDETKITLLTSRFFQQISQIV